MGFRKVNEESIKEVSSENKPKKEYKINKDGCYPIFDAEDLRRMQEPSKDYARKQLAEGAMKKLKSE